VKAKPVIPREQANRDVDEAVAYYLTEATEAVALGFIDALEKAYGHIARHPGHGITPLRP
jgi:toxin ParE1/3/4